MNTIHMENMNWPDIQAAVKNGYTTVVFGIGSTEQHGPHLPIKTDAALADEMVFQVAEKLGDPSKADPARGKTYLKGMADYFISEIKTQLDLK